MRCNPNLHNLKKRLIKNHPKIFLQHSLFTLYPACEGSVAEETEDEHENHTEEDADVRHEVPALLGRILQRRMD